MKYEMPMPSLGADMDSGKLLEWKVKPGDQVQKGQPVAVVETQKAAVEIESFRAGRIEDLLGKIGEVIDVGTIIARLEVEDKGEGKVEIESENKSAHVLASPAAKRRAQQAGLDLATIRSQLGQGRDIIELRDVEAALAARPSSTEAPPLILGTAPSPPMEITRNIREAIARQMARSKAEIPHYYLKNRINLDNLMKWLDEKNSKQHPESRIMLPAVFLRAIVLALKHNPNLNGFYDHGQFTSSTDIHLGVAIALRPGGVMAPAILGAHTMNLSEINFSFMDLVQRTRAQGLKNREMTEATVTVTNLGDLGAQEVIGVIFPPQVALIGIGRVRKEAIVDGQEIRAGFVADFTLSGDHRVTDGLAGSRFLLHLERILKNPNELDT
jgi:pyruvate dehydrogenase E2 component (dihydrolipoamide acetyltransferase)